MTNDEWQKIANQLQQQQRTSPICPQCQPHCPHGYPVVPAPYAAPYRPYPTYPTITWGGSTWGFNQ